MVRGRPALSSISPSAVMISPGIMRLWILFASPAKAGVDSSAVQAVEPWVPAFAGTAERVRFARPRSLGVCRLPDRLMHRDELGAVREGGFDLYVVDHLG